MKKIILSLLIFLAACTWTSEEKYLKKGESAKASKDWPEALNQFEKVVKVFPGTKQALKAAQEGAKVALIEQKDYYRLTLFLKHIILYSKDEKERIASQRLLAETYFEKLNDYPNAVIELNKTLDFFRSGKEHALLRFMLAKAYFFQNQFFQARSEVDTALKENVDQEFVFKALLLKANIFFNEKKLDDAITLYQRLMVEFPEKAKAEQVGLTLAVSYEEKEDFQKAIELLEDIRIDYTVPEMIDLKISRLKARQAQQPGAKGFRK